jgi:DNA-binding LacI/PurR family transcriptional regulator
LDERVAKRTKITRKDVAERAGVSVAVVSYVVNDGPRPVTPETRAKVIKAIEELGYYPNELARSLALQQSSTIGLMTPDFTNPVYGEVAEGIQEVCLPNGYLMVFVYSGSNPDREKELVRMFRAKQVDGVIMQPVASDPLEAIKPLRQARIPVVLLQQDCCGVSCVVLTDVQGGQMATQHLLDLGHRRIGLIKGRLPSAARAEERLIGYRQTHKAAGIEPDPALVIESDVTQNAGYQAMRQLLALPEPPTAVFCHNDVLAVGAMHAIQVAGLSIPGDISVVGFDDTAGSAHLAPPLTTIRFSRKEMGRRAATILFRAIERDEDDDTYSVEVPVELVVRASTGPPRQAK